MTAEEAKYTADRLVDYIQETEYPITIKELVESTEIVPLVVDDNRVGIFGFRPTDTVYQGKVATVKLIYVEPKYREISFHQKAKALFLYFKNKDFDNLEMYADAGTSKYINHKFHNEPLCYVHLMNVDETLNVL